MVKIPYDLSKVPPSFPFEAEIPRRRKKLKPEQEPYRLYAVSELSEFPPVHFLIPGWLAAGELTGLYAKGGFLKSFLALAWSCELAARGYWVVYIAAEGASGLNARIRAWQKHNGIAAPLERLRLMPSNVNLHCKEPVEFWIEAMKQQLGEHRPSLVVVDTLAQNSGGSENDAQDMGQFVEGAEHIRREFTTAVLVLHHTTKGGKVERGTESFRNASFAMHHLSNRRKLRGGWQITLSCDRVKDAEEPAEAPEAGR